MSLEKARAIIEKSGNSFQSKVANFLREKGWIVLISPFYVDSATDKSREIDLIAEKIFPIPSPFNNSLKSLRVRLFIECKYITHDVVFWFDSIDLDAATAWIHANTYFPPRTSFTGDQHYLRSGVSVAKLFASSQTQENDPIFKALNQCLSGYVSNRKRPPLVAAKDHEQIHVMNYPVVVCSSFDKFFKTEIATSGEPSPIVNNFLLEVNYAYVAPNTSSSVREHFLIDFLEFARLQSFLSSLDHEAQAAKLLLGDN